ncbi:MAG: hypothetical protein K2L07_10870 [Lachnospiraceae bacterium]|nr:hypothetical protein [Lachnospiraceae bacterium]
MISNVNNVYILTPIELTVIAAAKNIRGILSIQNTGKAVDETAVIQALNHLYQQQFILNAEDDGFVLEADLQKLIVGIEEAKFIILIRHFTDDAGMKMIYVGRYLVAVEQRKRNMSSVWIYEIPREELRDFLAEDMQQKAKSYRSILDEKRLFFEGIQKKHILQDDEAEAMGNIITMVEKITPKNNSVSCRMIVKDEKKWIQYIRGEKEVKYSEKDFLNSLVEMIEEELNDIS